MLYVCAALLFPGPPAAAESPLSPREAETMAFNTLVSRLKSKNIGFTKRPLMADYGAFGVSVEVSVPAQAGGTDGLFVLAVPLAGLLSAGDRSQGGGFGWCGEFALAFIDTLLSEPQAFKALVYFAADNWPATSGGAYPYPYAGFRALLDDAGDSKRAVIAYCDFPAADTGAPDALTVLRGTGTASSPLALVETFMRTCTEIGLPCFFDSDGGGRPAAAVLDAAAGIQIVYVTGASPARFAETPSGKQITAAEAAAVFYRYAAEISDGGINPDGADRNYAYIGSGDKRVFIPEPVLVLLTLFSLIFVLVLGFCLYYAAKSRYKYVLIPVFAAFVLLTAALLFVPHTNGGPNSPERVNPPAARTVNAADTPEAERYFTAAIGNTPFLDHRIVRISIAAQLTPLQYSLFFTSRTAEGPAENPSYFIYDAPMPYTTDSNRMEFILGSYPPNPLNIEIALPLHLSGEFTLEGLFPGDVTVVKSFPVEP
ncbi:MAG: hypothetical protein LBB47_04970 [Spirochaetaceae bacterium]|nr:hypothetical protein [Spirochaetaceae bacterium]